MSANFSSTHHFENNSSPLGNDTSFSFGGWFKADDATSNKYILHLNTNAGISESHILTAQNSGDLKYVALGDTTQSSTTGAYTANTWHHAIAVHLSIASRSVYLDANAGNTNTVSSVIQVMTHTWIGRSNAGGSTNFLGQLAECFIYNIALSADERTMLAAGFSPLLVRPEALIFYAPLIDGSGAEKDIVGGLSLTNTTAVTHISDYPGIIQPSAQILQFPSAAALAWAQDQYRFYNDDGSESLMTGIANQNVDITAPTTKQAIIRIQADTTGDQPTRQMKLQVKKTSDPDSAYEDVPVA